MENILIVTSRFYPEESIATIRLKKRIEILSKNYNVYILTNGEKINPNWGETAVYRIGSINQVYNDVDSLKSKIKGFILSRKKISNIIKKYKSISMLRSEKQWSKEGFKVATKIIEENNIDIVYSTVPELETIMLGNMIKEKFKDIKYIVEYRDIISNNETETVSKKVNIEMKNEEERASKLADGHVFVTQGIRDYYCKEYNINKYKVIYNGYRLLNDEVKVNIGQAIKISHIGSLYASRNPINFIKALGELLNENSYKKNIEVNFIGNIGSDILYNMRELVKKYKIEKNINIIGMVKNDEAIKVMFDSDINLLITHETGSEYAIPGKLFEYIGARKFIFAITNDKLVKDIMKEDKIGIVCSTDITNIKKNLKMILEEKINFNEETIPLGRAKKYSQENQEVEFRSFVKEVINSDN